MRQREKAVVVTVAMISVASIFFTNSTFSSGTDDVGFRDLSLLETQVYLNYNELIAMPRSTVYAELYCYSSLVERGNWTGVKLANVIERAGLSKQEGMIEFYALDGYSTKLELSTALQEDIIIAYEKDGRPLTGTT
ncbi:molybdopterin-dependent oxidoreductase [Candidatus Bathyarchaeota archaeon]|nr:molybdopterin-dependent oxidoreductase [Candidatus Bathyarchaeota archaeon]